MTTWARQIYEHDPLAIAKGEVNGYSSEHKFGAVPAMSQNQTGTIWDVNDTAYPWSSWSTAGTVDIPAVNASDNGKKITILGLDADYNAQSEEITLSSSGSVTSTNSYIRLYRAFLSNGSTNVGVINVQKSAVTVMRINAGKGQTLMAIYTVPAGYTAYLIQGAATCQGNADATGDMYIRYFGQDAFRIGHSFEFSGAGGQYMYKFAVPRTIPEKSDVDVRASVRSNNARLTAAFDLILVENTYRDV
jgi:hypothetical protein